MTEPRPDQVLTEMLAALAEAGVRTALLGGYAVVTWGIPRATFDMDLLVDADDAGVAQSPAALERRGLLVQPLRIAVPAAATRLVHVVTTTARSGGQFVDGEQPVATPADRQHPGVGFRNGANDRFEAADGHGFTEAVEPGC